MNFDIVIGHSNSDSYRENNLKFVLNYYSKFCPDSRIVVVEQNTDVKLPAFKNLVHIKLKNKDQNYNRGLGYNEGIKYCRKDLVLLIDNDCLLTPDILNNIEKYMGKNTVFLPYNYCKDLSESETNQLFKTNKIIGGRYRGDKNVCVGGALFISKRAFKYVGGFEKAISGWGTDDELFHFKCKTLLSIGRIQGNAEMFHLYHINASNPEYLKSERYIKNLEIMKKITSMNKDTLLNYIKNS